MSREPDRGPDRLREFNEALKNNDIKVTAANWGKSISEETASSLQDYKEKNEILERRIKYLEAQNEGLLTSNKHLIEVNKQVARDVQRAFSYGR